MNDAQMEQLAKWLWVTFGTVILRTNRPWDSLEEQEREAWLVHAESISIITKPLDPPETRKVIQVQAMVLPGMDNITTPSATLFVLCDDGTLWQGDGHGWWMNVSTPDQKQTILEESRAESRMLRSRLQEEHGKLREAQERNKELERLLPGETP